MRPATTRYRPSLARLHPWRRGKSRAADVAATNGEGDPNGAAAGAPSPTPSWTVVAGPVMPRRGWSLATVSTSIAVGLTLVTVVAFSVGALAVGDGWSPRALRLKQLHTAVPGVLAGMGEIAAPDLGLPAGSDPGPDATVTLDEIVIEHTPEATTAVVARGDEP